MTQNESICKFVYENTRDAIIVVSADNCFIEANPAALLLFPALKTLHTGAKLDDGTLPGVTDILNKKNIEFKFNDLTFNCEIKELSENGTTKIVWFSDITDSKDFLSLAKDYQIQLKETIHKKVEHIIEIQNNVMMNMADVIEDRDGNTGGHVKRTSKVVRLLLAEMQKDKDAYPSLTPQWCEVIARLAPLHDMGKMAISDTILNKPGKLTDEEFEIMKSHTTKGKYVVDHILSGVEDHPEIITLCENIVQFHHEKWDGSGYPQKLSGEQIPLEARIMAIADVYDALVSKRVYKPPMPFEIANKIMTESFGSHFDPNLKRYYDICRPQIEAYYAKDRES